jgi:hypothetical protein
MTSRISHTAVDSGDAYAQSCWWAAALEMAEDPEDPNEPGHEECMIFSPDGRTRLLFVVVPEPKTVKNRLHLDLRPSEGATREEEVARLLALGARQVGDHRRPDGSGWLTLADPEGNEFCVLRGDAEVADPHAHLLSRPS